METKLKPEDDKIKWKLVENTIINSINQIFI